MNCPQTMAQHKDYSNWSLRNRVTSYDRVLTKVGNSTKVWPMLKMLKMPKKLAKRLSFGTIRFYMIWGFCPIQQKYFNI